MMSLEAMDMMLGSVRRARAPRPVVVLRLAWGELPKALLISVGGAAKALLRLPAVLCRPIRLVVFLAKAVEQYSS